MRGREVGEFCEPGEMALQPSEKLGAGAEGDLGDAVEGLHPLPQGLGGSSWPQ